jgi:hypothetical protein
VGLWQPSPARWTGSKGIPPPAGRGGKIGAARPSPRWPKA